MFIQVKKAKMGKVCFQYGKEPKKLTPEEFKERIEKANEKAHLMVLSAISGFSSSKEGREKYFSRKGISDMPFLLFNLWDWLMGYKIWYSEDGCRVVLNDDVFKHLEY
jgi:hypothetical protein